VLSISGIAARCARPTFGQAAAAPDHRHRWLLRLSIPQSLLALADEVLE
jgi:hypothetical protein